MTDKQKAIGRGKFLKICEDSMYAYCWQVNKGRTCLTIVMDPFFQFCSAVN